MTAYTESDVITAATAGAALLGMDFADADETDQAEAMSYHRVILDSVAPSIVAKALLDAADAIQSIHPGEVKASVNFLRARAERVIG